MYNGLDRAAISLEQSSYTDSDSTSRFDSHSMAHQWQSKKEGSKLSTFFTFNLSLDLYCVCSVI